MTDLNKRCYEFRGMTAKGNPSEKFWNVEVKGPNYTAEWGKIGTFGQSQTKTIGNMRALDLAFKKINEKIDKGYDAVDC